MKYALALTGALLLAPTAQAQNARCQAEFKAEVARIEREAAARSPAPGSDQRAQQQFMQAIHAALEAAGARAEACERASQPKAAARPDRYKECMERAEQQLDQAQRDLPRHLDSTEQQRRLREAETRIGDERMACMRSAR